MKKLLFATVSIAALAASGVAQSADLPYKAPPPAAAPITAPIPWTWTGFYIGGHFGAGWGTKDWDFKQESFTDAEGHTSSEAFDFPSSFNINGFLGGGQLGYRFQAGPWVFGIQGSFTGADIHGRSTCFENEFVCNSKIDWLAAVTGQFGWAVDRALIYFTGGVAWAHDKSSINFTRLSRCIDGEGCDFNKSQTRVGGLIGAGVSYAFTPSWSAFIEYNFMDFGKHTVDFTVTNPIICGLCTVSTRYSVDIDQQVHVIKAGINWRFDWGGWGKAAAPIAARY